MRESDMFELARRRLESGASTRGETPLIVSTWPFGKSANDEALAVLQRGG